MNTEIKILELEKRESALNELVQNYQLVFDTSNQGLWFLSCDMDRGINIDEHTLCFWSNSVRERLGFSDLIDFPNVLGSLLSQLHPSEYEDLISLFLSHINTSEDHQQKFDQECQLKLKSGSYHWFRLSGVITRNQHTLLFIGSLTDITEEIFSRTVMDGICSVVVTDNQLNILKVNTSIMQITGYLEKELIGSNFSHMLDEENYSCLQHKVKKLKLNHSWKDEVNIVFKNGEKVPAILEIRAIRTAQNLVTHYAITGIDISNEKAAQKAEYQALMYDSLTELPKIELFQQNISDYLATHTNLEKMALISLDVDNFSRINNRFSYSSGDFLLQSIARRLTSIVDKRFVCRYSSDEFLICLITDVKKESLKNKISELHQLFDIAFNLNGEMVNVKSTIGADIIGSDKIYNALNLSSIQNNANLSRYKARKANKQGSIYYYTQDFHKDVVREMNILAQLPPAIENGLIEIYFQPQIDCSTRKIVGAEALSRWYNEEMGQIPPDEFIAIAEKHNLMQKFFDYIYLQAARLIQVYFPNREDAITLSVNISPTQLKYKDFVESVNKITQKSGIERKRVILEVTENVMLEDLSETKKTISSLYQEGYMVSIDDFGTGYSSLSYLSQLDVSEVKIDRAFIKEIAHSTYDQALVKAVIAISKTRHIKVVAEGAETKEHVDWLERHYCDVIQGFYFDKALPIAQLAEKWG